MVTGEINLISRHTRQIGPLVFFTAVATISGSLSLAAQSAGFRNAPAAASQMKNPYAGDAQAAAGGKKLYVQNCAQCHGNNLQGMGPAPTLVSSSVKQAAPGDLFWFITNGELNKGMPAWSQLPKQQRWQIVTFLDMRNAGQ
jgi:mono/diheme cytochrome c family protein